LIFGLGLILAGMTDPLKVKGFLDLAGAWDPSLALVMGGAIALGLFVFARAAKRSRSWSGAPMELPTNRTIDGRLVLGGVLFGTGWGIGGFCPGPALVALGSGMGAAGVFVAAMLIGMVLHDKFLLKG
jgi:uncharacterized membrane protein YedE/YeeE